MLNDSKAICIYSISLYTNIMNKFRNINLTIDKETVKDKEEIYKYMQGGKLSKKERVGKKKKKKKKMKKRKRITVLDP